MYCIYVKTSRQSLLLSVCYILYCCSMALHFWLDFCISSNSPFETSNSDRLVALIFCYVYRRVTVIYMTQQGLFCVTLVYAIDKLLHFTRIIGYRRGGQLIRGGGEAEASNYLITSRSAVEYAYSCDPNALRVRPRLTNALHWKWLSRTRFPWCCKKDTSSPVADTWSESPPY